VRDGRTILGGEVGIDFEVHSGEHWALIGPNGSGKTTLLKIAAMRLVPTRGYVEVLGECYGSTDVRTLRRRVALVSQTTLRELRPSMSAHDAVLSRADSALQAWWRDYSYQEHSMTDRLLEEAGLASRGQDALEVLSEGERQQVLLARALMNEPGLILLDEPAAGLDLGARERLLARIRALAEGGSTAPLVLVTHHVEEIPPGITHAALRWIMVILSGGRYCSIECTSPWGRFPRESHRWGRWPSKCISPVGW
jgi:iron complex transport system ATP-binding protein